MAKLEKDSSEVPVEALRDATQMAATLVRKFGDTYWPFFERLDRELELRERRERRLAKFK